MQGVRGTRLSGKDTLRRLSEDLVEVGLQKNSKGFAREVFLELAELVRNYGRKINGYPQLSDELLEDSALLGMSVLRTAAKSGDIRSAMKLVDLRPNKEPISIEHRIKGMSAEETVHAGIQVFLNAGYSPEEAQAVFERMVVGSATHALPDGSESVLEEVSHE